LNLLYQVRDDFGVSFGDELVALRGELALEIKIIFDNAVVNYDDAAGTVAVRMRILFGRTTVRSPARVADAEGAIEGLLAKYLFKIRQLARRAPQVELVATGMADGDTSRVVTPVLEAP